jgi:hypothetical protein
MGLWGPLAANGRARGHVASLAGRGGLGMASGLITPQMMAAKTSSSEASNVNFAAKTSIYGPYMEMGCS